MLFFGFAVSEYQTTEDSNLAMLTLLSELFIFSVIESELDSRYDQV